MSFVSPAFWILSLVFLTVGTINNTLELMWAGVFSVIVAMLSSKDATTAPPGAIHPTSWPASQKPESTPPSTTSERS